MDKKSLLTIGRLAKITGVHIKSLRYYDEIGILPPAYTDPTTGYRYYMYQQSYMVEAIQFCVELGIPLKDFPEFFDDQNHQIHFAHLIEKGSILANEKIKSIQEKLIVLNELQESLVRNETIKSGNRAITYELPEKTCWAIPFYGKQNSIQFCETLDHVLDQLEKKNIQPGYECGMILRYEGLAWSPYLYTDIMIAEERRNLYPEILYLPPKKYLCEKAPSEKSFLEAPDRIQEIKNVKNCSLIFEIELFGEVYSSSSPCYEWRYLLE